MSEWKEKLGEAMLPVLELTRELPAEPWRLPLVRALAVVSNGLASTSAEPEPMAAALAAAVREAVLLEAAGHVGPKLVLLLAPAENAVLEHPRVPRMEGIVRRAPGVEPLLRASRGNPKLLVVAVADDLPAGDGAVSDEDDEDDDEEELEPPPDAALVDEESVEPSPRRALPKEDPERFDPDEAAPPPVKLADDGGEPRPLRAFYDGIADRALETMSMLARHRTERRMTEWTEEEVRILECGDALAATGADCVRRALEWWRASLESPDPWKTWAPCFALGVIDGVVPLRAIRAGLRAMPENGAAHARLAAEALVSSPHPELRVLVSDLCNDAHPVARAVGVDLSSRFGALSPEQIAHHLGDANAPVTIAAIRAAVRCEPPAPALLPHLIHWMQHDDRAIAAEAARALMLLGRPEPLLDLRRQGKLAARLGLLGVIELLVMGGEANDLALVRALLSRTKASAAHLDAIARLGHPGTWAFLLHHLGEEDFARPAADALYTLFGEMVGFVDRFNTSAWRDAIGSARLDPEKRIRRGDPWTPAVVAAECTSTSALLSRQQIEQRLDELMVRTGVRADVDLGRWSSVSAPALSGYLARMDQVSRNWAPGSWASKSF